MQTIFYPNNERHFTDHGWLKSYFTFSFAHWYDPNKLSFGKLRVINDDLVAPKMGFDMHPHMNMEIITFVTHGVVEHQDNLGHKSQTKAGEVQVMSAGTGILHSEFNPDEKDPLKLLQIWVLPKKLNIEPRYDQKTFDVDERDNNWQTVVSPDGKEDSLIINQDAYFKTGNFHGGQNLSYKVEKKGNGVFLFVIRGTAQIGECRLRNKDAIGVSEIDEVDIEILEDSELLLIEVPME